MRASLAEEIDRAEAATPTIWWLGHSGFALKYKRAILYVDPLLSVEGAPLRPEEIRHAGLVLATHAHPRHLDAATVNGILAASPRAKLVVPKSACEHTHTLGVPYQRMITTNADLRVEFLDDRIYAVPSAHNELDWTALGGYPYLGYLIRFGGYTIYHAGDCISYDSLVPRLRPYNVTAALLPITGRREGRPGNFDATEAAQLAQDIGAEWLVPMHYDAGGGTHLNRFLAHMLGQRPEQRFKIFEPAEGWALPEM